MTEFPPPPLGNRPELPPLENAALLLDLDGTLLDIADAPDRVTVADGLPEVLRAVRARLGDALAIITGRPIATIDALLPGLPYAVAGEHGAAIRHAPATPIERPALPKLPRAWLAAAEQLAAAHHGVLLEYKPHGFTLHYRAAPARGGLLGERLRKLLAEDAGRFTLLPARMAWEVRPRGADKGGAVDAVMARAPFAGRRPLFVGDDITDEDAIAAARRAGGAGLRVADAFGDPAGVRAWLHAIGAENGSASAPAG